jgi:hypothetical protein
MKSLLFAQRLSVTALFVCTFVVTLPRAGNASRAADKDVKLSGCLIRGEGNGDGYLLANPPNEPWLSSPGKQVTPSALGTSGDYATMFYWLDGDDDLRQHVGHKVEIEGELEGDVKDGEIKTERKENWTEMTVKSDGRTIKARVPNTSMFPASEQDKERKGNILVRRVDVKSVRMLGATCN